MKEKIQQLVANGKTKEALEALAKHNSNAILLQAKYNKLEEDQSIGILERSTYSLELNRINHSITSLLDSTNFNNPNDPPASASPPAMPTKKSVFFSYAHEDKELQQRLRVHLSPLRRSDKINDWSDEEIQAGSEWDEEIKKRLRSANIILLLVSPDFIASDYIWDTELKTAMERHNNGEAIVVPIILKPCQWHEMPFGKLQALPAGAKPVVEWASQDQALYSVAEGIRKLL